MEGKLFLVYPSIIKEAGGELEIEFDFCESLRLYLNTFKSVSFASPIATETMPGDWRRGRQIKDLPWRDRLKVIPLPWAYSTAQFLRHYFTVRQVLDAEIRLADYLVFHPHTLIGDWPMVAVRRAIKMHRRYVIDADVVYDRVALSGWSRDSAWKRHIKKETMLRLFKASYQYCLEHSSLALLQGQDVFDAYSPFCSNAHKVYHTPVDKQDYITATQLQEKLFTLRDRRPLTVCYVGRAIDMKGPLDWLKTVHEIISSGSEITATWLGDGPLLPNMRAMANDLGITNYVRLPGHVSDRRSLLRTLRQADLFLFCHLTPESPRCLVEALASGCPLVGYDSAYARDLVAGCGGGQFATIGNWHELADTVKALHKDRQRVQELVQSASASGRLYERDQSMQHRIDLIKTYVRPR